MKPGKGREGKGRKSEEWGTRVKWEWHWQLNRNRFLKVSFGRQMICKNSIDFHHARFQDVMRFRVRPVIIQTLQSCRSVEYRYEVWHGLWTDCDSSRDIEWPIMIVIWFSLGRTLIAKNLNN
jgi:hypothetical protein